MKARIFRAFFIRFVRSENCIFLVNRRSIPISGHVLRPLNRDNVRKTMMKNILKLGVVLASIGFASTAQARTCGGNTCTAPTVQPYGTFGVFTTPYYRPQPIYTPQYHAGTYYTVPATPRVTCTQPRIVQAPRPICTTPTVAPTPQRPIITPPLHHQHRRAPQPTAVYCYAGSSKRYDQNGRLIKSATAARCD